MRETMRSIATVAALGGIAVLALAFTEPIVGPTGGTVYPPINTSAVAQTKSGSFTSSGTVTGNILNAITLITTNGSVGIGTASPDTKLQIAEGNDRLAFYQSSDNRLNIQTLLDGQAFATYGTYGGGENRLILQSLVGNVGIGTTNPAYKLDVAGDVNATCFRVSGGTCLSSGGVSQIIAGSNVTISPAGGTGAVTINASGGGGGYWAANSTAIYKTNSGGVGIGTSNPQALLDVYSPFGSAGGHFMFGGFTDSTRDISYDGGSDGIMFFTNTGPSSGGTGFYSSVANAVPVTMMNSGRVGINMIPNTYPSYTLDVNGTIRANNVSPSDARLKKNIIELSGVLEKLTALRAVSFEWNELAPSSLAGTKSDGVIAQEAEALFPELVSTAPDADGYKSMNYNGFTAVLLEAIKEQQKEIDALKTEIELLKSR